MITFADLLAKLSHSQVKYMLVGGLALHLCGYARATFDMDIIVDNVEDNISRLLA